MKRTSWIGRRSTLHAVVVLVVALAAWRVASTHSRLAHTVDEPTHISSSLEWLLGGTQRLHAENPPFGRATLGVGSLISGYPLPSSGTAPQRGTELLYADDDYLGNLGRARLGTLPFFLLTVLLVWHWAQQLAGPRAGLLASVSVATLPPVLAHSGLATTDMPFVAAFLLLVWWFAGWLEAPTARSSAILGALLGLAVATKYSTLLFFPPVALALVGTLRWVDRSRGAERDPTNWGGLALGLGMAIPIAAFVVWGAFRFDVGRVDEIPGAERVLEIAFPAEESLGRRLADAVSHQPMPAPDAIHGLLFLKAHADLGHDAYLLGSRSESGFWYFYPMALAVKTPLSFFLLLIFALVGLSGQAGRRAWRFATPALAASAVLLISMTSTINIGLRHVLVVYPLLAVSIGLGSDALLDRLPKPRRAWAGAAVALALVWQMSLVVRVFPDYLSWFNPLAGGEPGRILVDSDLDWGQDGLQLGRLTSELGVSELNIAYFGSLRLCDHDLPALNWLPPDQPVVGWVAISEMYYRDHWRVLYDDACDRSRGAGRAPEGASYGWLRDHEPIALAGGSIRLYNIQPD